jgi:hypothetical protein
VAAFPTVFVIASDENRNGKTMLARLITDYLLLDGRDPFVLDTDTPEGPLRQYFPGRTALADFSQTQGEMRVFDTIMAAPGRDYVVDLPARHLESFVSLATEIDFVTEAKKQGFRLVLFFIVDRSRNSLRNARELAKTKGWDLFVSVRNEHVGSSWPKDEGALVMPALARNAAAPIADRRFSIRNFVLGDTQGLDHYQQHALNTFLYDILGSLNSLEPAMSLEKLKR